MTKICMQISIKKLRYAKLKLKTLKLKKKSTKHF